MTLCGVAIPARPEAQGPFRRRRRPARADRCASSAPSARAISARIFRPAIRNGRVRRRASSSRKPVELLQQRGGIIANADITILAEAPQIVAACRGDEGGACPPAPHRRRPHRHQGDDHGEARRHRPRGRHHGLRHRHGAAAMMFPGDLAQAGGRTDRQCRASGLQLATAESCTGGLVAGLHHLDRRLIRCFRGGLRHLFQRRQDADDRRAGGADRTPWRGQRRSGPRHGRRRTGAIRRRSRRGRDRHCRTRRRNGAKPVGSFISRRAPAAAAQRFIANCCWAISAATKSDSPPSRRRSRWLYALTAMCRKVSWRAPRRPS